jgi:hypothetical protein
MGGYWGDEPRKKGDNSIIWYGCISIIITILFICLSGCSSLGGILSPDVTPELTPEQRITEALKSTNWLVTLSILGMAVSVMAIMNGSKMGIGALLGSLTSLTLSLMVIKYAGLIAIIGLVASVGLCGYAIYVKRKGMIEVVKNVQEIVDTQERTGMGIETSLTLRDILDKQSPTTQKIVAKIKEKL